MKTLLSKVMLLAAMVALTSFAVAKTLPNTGGGWFSLALAGGALLLTGRFLVRRFSNWTTRPLRIRDAHRDGL